MPDTFHGQDFDVLNRFLVSVANKACRTYTINTQFSEDIVQELWIVVLRLMDTYDPSHAAKAKFGTYIRMWMTENANRHARLEANRQNQAAITFGVESDLIDSVIEDNSTTHHSLFDFERDMANQELLSDLDVTLVANGFGFNDQEIADILDCSVSEVSNRRRKAFKDLKDKQ